MKTRFNSDEAVLRFARKIKGMGVDDELRSLGAKMEILLEYLMKNLNIMKG